MTYFTTTNEATEKQLTFINDLLAKKVVPAHIRAEIEDTFLTKATASQFIEMLKDFPYKRRTSTPAATSTFVSHPAPAVELAHGFYTVADGEGGWVTFRVRTENCERSYKNFAFVTSAGLKVWKGHADKTRAIAAAQFLLTGSVDEARSEFLNQSEANAMRSNTCLCCLKTLTVPASVARGLGPVCARQMGL
ncbi:MAG: hypothetical protein EBR81_14320 [Proteobacteria bacterium]|nr:hypothetical protein [Pseudomonadota bacterium]